MDAVKLLEEMVAIPSLSGEEQALAGFLVQRMADLGFAAHVDDAGNAVGLREQPDGQGNVSRDAVLLGHVDTVPGQVKVRREEGRLYGRGAVDAKGPLAAFITAAARCRLRPGTRLIVIGAVEEESATSKGAYHVARQYRPAACIIGEPSGWDSITLGYKGRLLLDYSLHRPMGHTAGPQQAVAEAAVAWWNALAAYAEDYNRGRERLFDRLLPSLREIRTGSDGLTNTVAMTVGLRLPPDIDVEGLITHAQHLAGEATVQGHGHEPAFAAGRQNDLARAFNRALRQRGVRPRYVLKTGTSDMNVVGPRWGCPIVAYGPGDSALDHTPQEHIVIEEYLQAIDVLTDVLGDL